MQIFAPWPDPYRIAADLDNKRLGKQRIEALDCALHERKHVCITAWAGHERYAAMVAMACMERWAGMGYSNEASLPRLGKALAELPDTGPPPWWGDERIHAYYRAYLVGKKPEHYGPLYKVEPALGDCRWELMVPGWSR